MTHWATSFSYYLIKHDVPSDHWRIGQKKDVSKNDEKIKKPYLHWPGTDMFFFLIFDIKVISILSISHQPTWPCTMFITKLLDSELFFISRRIIEGEKMGKTISIPFWCRYGFLQYLLQKLLNRLIWHICVYYMNFLLEVLFKTTKTAKNHIYTSSV